MLGGELSSLGRFKRHVAGAQDESKRAALGDAMAMSSVTLEIQSAKQSPDDRDNIQPDAAYLFACHLRWDKHGDLKAYLALVSALDSNSEEVQVIAESLLRRKSPRPKKCLQCGPTASSAGTGVPKAK